MPAPSTAPVPWPPPAPAQALTCPRCEAPAQPASAPQRCACGQRFLLRAGALLDPTATPPTPDPASRRIAVRSSGLLLRRYAALEADGLVEGALDPITGHVPMSSDRLAYRAVYSVAVWRRIPWGTLALVLLCPAPLLLLSLVGAASGGEALGYALFFVVPLAAVTAWGLWAALGVRANWVRVVSTKGELRIRFDSPSRRRRRFHQELLRRCGLAPGEIP